MKKQLIMILSIVVFAGGFFYLYFSGPVKKVSSVVGKADQQTNSSQKWESKIDDQASVTVTITPVDISSQSKKWKFDIVMDTHSVELDQDMTKIAVLIDDQGKEYKPLGWNGPVGGHHREGVLMFNQIMPIPKSLELKISGIGGVVRSFAW